MLLVGDSDGCGTWVDWLTSKAASQDNGEDGEESRNAGDSFDGFGVGGDRDISVCHDGQEVAVTTVVSACFDIIIGGRTYE